ncbi:MAG: hypothetical protein IPN34_27485 [Planctomycetes bacterium]|nr:hypothetical protein [Planctomycetota bacterium]
MAKVIGRTGAIGIAVEATQGTAVAPTFFVPVQSYSFDDKVEYVKNDSAMGRIEEFNDADIIKEWGEGEYGGKIFIDSIGAELTALFGQSPTSTERTTTNVFDHAYTLANNNDHKSLSVSYVDDIQDVRSPFAMINSWSLEVAVDDYVKRTINLISKKSASVTNSPAFTNEVEFIPSMVSVKMASAVAGLDAASAINVTSFNMEVAKNAEALYVLGSKEPEDIINKQFGVTGSIELYFENTTYRDYVFANTHRAARLSMADTTVDLGSGHNPELRFDLNEIVFSEFERGWDSNDPLKQTLSFEALVSVTDSAMISARLTNTQDGTDY